MEIVIVYGFHGKCYAGREYRSKFVNIFRELIGVEGKLKLGVTEIGHYCVGVGDRHSDYSVYYVVPVVPYSVLCSVLYV